MSRARRPLSYRAAGVDMAAGDRLVEHIRKSAPAIGGFAGLYPLARVREARGRGAALVACTDGVGTKLKLAFMLDRHDTIGIDLVAMNVNDLVTCGALPLFFLDYFATARLDLRRAKRVLAGIMEGCRLGRCALLGGETAELPGFYRPGEYDLAGFCVGVVSGRDLIDGSRIRPGDVVLGLPSSGLHSNGFSLVRSALGPAGLRRLGPRLLAPTRIYVDDVARLRAAFKRAGRRVLGLAHITGGGIPGNLERVLPAGCRAVVRASAWAAPAVFREVQAAGRVPEAEMWQVFNMGVGMAAVVRRADAGLARRVLPDAVEIGEIAAGRPGVELC